MISSTKQHIHELGGFAISAVGAITANQESIEWGLRCGASLVAIIAGAATVWSIFRKNREAK